jgi:hypothetical protein
MRFDSAAETFRDMIEAAAQRLTAATKALCARSGTFDAVSAMVDWQFADKFNAYAGVMYSQVYDGLANGDIKTNNIDPTVGLRLRFCTLGSAASAHSG